jgi:LAS superfamily LD-carboxypeptidase LdcB
MESFSYIANAPKAVISSKYGYRTHPITGKKNVMHYGLDIAHPTGTQVLAMADGVIIDSKMANNSCGGTIAVDHGEINGKKIKTRFCHNSKLLKKTGDQVKKGEVIAISGGGRKDPGRGGSTGSHIHFEVYENGNPVNPISYYNGTVGYKKSKTIAPQTKNSKVSDEEDLPIPDEDLPIPDETSSKTYSNLPFDFLSTDEKDPGPRLNIFGSKYDKLLKGFASAFSSFGGIGKLKSPTTSSDVQPEKKITTKTTTTNTKKDDTKDLPQEIKSAISKLEKNYNLDITDEHIQKELEQEGGYREDAGGENSQARMQINKMINDARKKFPKLGKLGIVSGYRSYNDQVANFGNKAKTRGIDDTQRANTIPGFSQHHTGKAFDIFSVETSWWNKNSDVRDWVAKNASKYGFDVTYKKQGPLRIAEPWHLYYVGGEVNEQNFIKNKILKEEIERIKQLIKTT